MSAKKTQKIPQASFLLSSDSLSGYGLDIIFQIASELDFAGIDLAMWKNFDAWHIEYVKELMKKYDLKIPVVQISRKVNIKEMNQAVELARAVNAEVITINAPEFFNIKSGRFLKGHLPSYKAHNKNMKFSIINPEKINYLGIIPKYYFQDMVQIIKKHKMYLGLDIANVDESILENQFVKKMSNFMPYLAVIYLSDVDKRGNGHLPLGDGMLKLPYLLKKFKQHEFDGFFSLKLEISKKDLADIDKVELIVKKCRRHFQENYEDLSLS